MLKDLLLVLSAVWQEQPAALAFYLAKKPIWENFLLTLTGALIGATLVFFFPEEVKFVSKQIRGLLKLIKNLIGLEIKSKTINHFDDSWVSKINLKIQSLRQTLINKIVKNGFPQVLIFIVASLPFPGSLPIAIAASRLINLQYSYFIITAATFTRTYLLVLFLYTIGGNN